MFLRKFSIAILFFIDIHGFSQVNSSCNIPIQLKNTYEFDVSKLALNRIIQLNSTYKDSIAIPEVYKDTIWAGLAAIFNTTIPERDSVFDIYCVKDVNCNVGSYMIIDIGFDTNYTWTQNWQNSQILTGYQQLDDLLSKFNFTYRYLYFPNWISLKTPLFLNETILLDSLTKFDGILYASDGDLTCAHHKLSYSKTNNIRTYYFEYGFDPGQYFYAHRFTWTFTVDEQCNVTLINKTHEGTNPPKQNCDITSSIKDLSQFSKEIRVSPNPTSDLLNISSGLNLKYKVSICDLAGKELLQTIFTSKIDLSLENYKSGIYFLSVYDESNQKIKDFKVIKE